MGAQGNMNVRVFGNRCKCQEIPDAMWFWWPGFDIGFAASNHLTPTVFSVGTCLPHDCCLYMHSLKMTEPAIIAQKVANVAIKTTKLWTWTQSHLETMLGHNGVLLTRFVSTNRKRQFETMWCHQHQTWMGRPVHGHFDGKIVEHVELNEGCPQQNTLYYFMIFQSRFQFFGENIGKQTCSCWSEKHGTAVKNHGFCSIFVEIHWSP